MEKVCDPAIFFCIEELHRRLVEKERRPHLIDKQRRVTRFRPRVTLIRALKACQPICEVSRQHLYRARCRPGSYGPTSAAVGWNHVSPARFAIAAASTSLGSPRFQGWIDPCVVR